MVVAKPYYHIMRLFTVHMKKLAILVLYFGIDLQYGFLLFTRMLSKVLISSISLAVSSSVNNFPHGVVVP